MYSITQHDLNAAEQAWRKGLSCAEKLSAPIYVSSRQWLATCHYWQGKLTEAHQLFCQALHGAIQIGFHHSIIFCEVKLATIALDQGNIENAAETLAKSKVTAYQYQDWEHIAESQRLYDRLYFRHGDIPAARAALAEAIDRFERLGLRHELAEAREELARLETTITLGSEPASA